MQTKLQTIVACEKGPVRERNEDSVSVETGDSCGWPEKGTILIVADGMGGLHSGEIASAIVVKELPRAYFQSQNRNSVEALVQSISDVNQIVYRTSFNEIQERAMGSTVVAAVITNEILITANVGDSRAYICRNGNLRQLSKDHSLRKNHFSMFEAGNAQILSHVLTQAIGPLPEVTPHVSISKIFPEDIVLLCSDGLSSFVSDREIKDVLANIPFEDTTTELLKLVTDRKGDDNLSIVLTKIVSIGSYVKRQILSWGDEPF